MKHIITLEVRLCTSHFKFWDRAEQNDQQIMINSSKCGACTMLRIDVEVVPEPGLTL